MCGICLAHLNVLDLIMLVTFGEVWNISWFIHTVSFCLCRYERYSRDGNTCYAVAGYATVYEYYAYPNNTRPRISQMLVLPPFQRIGLGAHLLDNIYRHYASQTRVVDITGLPYILLCTFEHPMLQWHCAVIDTTVFFQITFFKGKGCILWSCQCLELYCVTW
jgi:GNAT superfamily N-acetyltransferase